MENATIDLLLFSAIFAAFILAAQMGLAVIKFARGIRGSDWQDTNVFLPKVTITGERASGDLMTRVVDGKRQYKKLTDQEQEEIYVSQSW